MSVPDLAVERAERIRSNLADRSVVAEGTEIHVTASIGLAFAAAGRSRNEMALIMTADEALYPGQGQWPQLRRVWAPRDATGTATDGIG